jgi:aminoglycoside phosphotransferase (APT) family kinase protein
MTGARIPDELLWRSVTATLRDVVAPGLRPGHELDTVVQLQGLADYAASRPADQGAERTRRLADALGTQVADLPQALERASAVLVAAVEGSGDLEVARRVREELLQQLDEDIASAAPLLDTFSGHPATDVEPVEPRVPEGELRALTAWFGQSLGGPVEVTRATVLSGGHSRRMLVLDVAGPQGTESFVVRIEQGGTFGTDGTLEAEAMQALGRSGVAVAPVRWIERDPAPLGQPFFVMDLVPGGSAVDDVVLESFLHALHAVHAVDPHELSGSLGPPPSPEDAVQAQVDRWLGVYRASVPVPVPLLDEAASWLRRFLRPTGPVAVVHGDPGPGNFLHQHGTITALTDWEFVHHGDVAEDWAYFATIRARKLKSADEWYAVIERTVGVRNDPATWRAWEAFNQFKGACANLTALRLFTDGTATTPNLLAIGTAVHARFLRRLAELVGEPSR